MGNSVSGRSVCPIEGDSISYFEINEEQRAKNMLPSCFREAVWLELGMVGVGYGGSYGYGLGDDGNGRDKKSCEWERS